MQDPIFPRRIHFGEFEADLIAGELRKDGLAEKILLQDQPLQILRALVNRSGEMVSREELVQLLWKGNTIVDFDPSLNKAINRLRESLGDSAEAPRYIETLSRRGYRFIAQKNDSADRKTLLAVLPFENLTRDPTEDYFSEGLTEELITHLGSSDPEELSVIAHASVKQIEDTRQTVEEIGQRLGVAYLLKGSVRRFERRVRISAQLIRVRDRSYIWTKNYDSQVGNLIAIENEIAQAIANEVRSKLSSPQRVQLPKRHAINPDAQVSYLRGRYFSFKESRSGLTQAISLYKQAIKKDPGYASSYAGLSTAYMRLGHWLTLPPEQAFPKARDAALRALELDGSLSEAHAALADVRFLYDWHWREAEVGYQRALALNPSSIQTLRSYASFLIAMNRLTESRALARDAQRVDPASVYMNAFAAVQFYSAGEYRPSIEAAKRTLEMDPGYSTGHLFLGLNYEQIGHFAAAIEELREAVSTSGVKQYIAHLAHAMAVSGRRSEAEEILIGLTKDSRDSYVSPWLVAVIYSGLGDKDQAFEWLEKSYQTREHDMVYLRMWPQFANLRPELRFKDLLRRMNFPPTPG